MQVQTKRIAEWLDSIDPGSSVELRFRNGPVDAIDWYKETVQLAEELVQLAEEDADESGSKSPRTYQLMAIYPNQERHECRIPIRIKAKSSQLDHSAEKLVATALTLVETQAKIIQQMASREERTQERTDEFYMHLEKLRSQVQERELEKEKHDRDIEMRQQMTDVAVPLGVAIVNKITGGAVPMLGAVDPKSVALVSIVKTLNDTQQQQLMGVLGEKFEELKPIIMKALDGQGDTAAFVEFISSLSPNEIGAIQSILNPGQQAAMVSAFSDALSSN